MIYSAFSAGACGEPPWRAQLLGYSWGRVRQPGELVHLRAQDSPAGPSSHPLARTMETQRWSPHPYTRDHYPPYQTAAALLEWLFVERIDGTVLVLEPTCAFVAPVAEEVRPGQARGTPWADQPRGEGPFGLGPGFDFLDEVCVDRTLSPPAVRLPVLIHATELRKLVARWLELMSIIRAETAGLPSGPRADADKLAYAIAAAEARIPHAAIDLGLANDELLLPSATGETKWDPELHGPWESLHPAAAAGGPGPQLRGLLSEFVERRAQGLELSLLRPQRQRGVREGKILGSMFLEIPGRQDTVSLNSSGAAIWEVCDGTRSLAEVNQELEARFEMPPGSLRADVEVVIKRLERIGALRLTPA